MPDAERPYSKREIDALETRLVEKIENAQSVIELKVSENHNTQVASLTRIETQVAFTNGKVKKIILALVLLSGITIGLGFDHFGPVLGLILSI